MDLVLLVVDGANVVGSVPDGWWRDRRGAAERLRDHLIEVSATGLPSWPGPLDVVLVVEGAARGVESRPGVRVVAASGSGDDAVVAEVSDAVSDEVHAAGERTVLVATANRELLERVRVLGARGIGPRSVRG